MIVFFAILIKHLLVVVNLACSLLCSDCLLLCRKAIMISVASSFDLLSSLHVIGFVFNPGNIRSHLGIYLCELVYIE